MSAKSFVILYTKQTKKKNKVWHDGTLKFINNNKGLLYDDKGSKLDSVLVKDDIQIGDQLESDHYLITIEEVLSSSVEKTNDHAGQVSTLPHKRTSLGVQSLFMQGRSNLKPNVAGNCPRQNRVGLKRQRNSGFVPPLLRTSMQIDNQKEISPFISDKVREGHQNMNQTSYTNPSEWSSFATHQNMSNNISDSLNSENISNNQTETYSSKSWSLENGNVGIGGKATVHSGIFQKIMSGINESPAEFPAANQFCIDESRTAKAIDPGSQFNRGKSRDLITDPRIQTSYERMYTENNIQNSTFDSGIQQCNKSLPNFARKTVTVQDADEAFNANFSEAKRENIPHENLLLKGKNKRTASQVLALLKSNTSDIAKNTERESSAKKLPFSIDRSSSEFISRDPKPFKDHSNSNEMEEKTYAIDQESLEPNENIGHFSDFAKKTDNELYSSPNAEKDSNVIKIKSQCDFSEENFLDISISPDLDFDIKSDNTCEIDFTSTDERINGKKILFPIEGFDKTISMEESSEPLVSDRNDKNFNKTISEKSSFIPTTLTGTVYPTQDKPQDEVSSDNITKRFLHAPKLQENEEVDFSFSEFDNKSKDKNIVSNRHASTEKYDPLLSNIHKREDYPKFQELKSKNTFKNDSILYESAISSLSDSPITKTEENECPTVNTNSTIQVDRTVDKNFKDNQSKRPLVFATTEEPQSKRIRIEPGCNFDSAITRDDMYRIENKIDDISENLSSKVSCLAKGCEYVELLPSENLNQTENILEVSENFLDGEVSKSVHLEEVSENVHFEEVSENALAEAVSENFLAEAVSENFLAEAVSENFLAEEVSENFLVEEMSENFLAEELSENVLEEKVSENVNAEELSENFLAKEVPENALAEKLLEKFHAKELSENALTEEVSKNVQVEKLSENVYAEELSENFLADEVPENTLAEELSEKFLVDEVPENTLAEELSKNVHAEELSGNFLADEVPENTFAEELLGDFFAEEVSENVLIKKMSGLVQSEDNCQTSSISSSDHILNQNFSLTKNNDGELPNVNAFDFSKASNDKISKFYFKSLSENKNKESNCSQAEDNIIQENKSLNDNVLKINEPFSKSPLSNTVVQPITDSSVACWDNSLSDEGLNFDLSFDFDDNSHQVNDKQIDTAQNSGSDNLLIRNVKSVSYSLDPQNQEEEKALIETGKKTETVEIPKSISVDDSYIDSNVILTRQNISDPSDIKRSLLDNLNPQLKEKNDHSDFINHSIPATRDTAKIFSSSSCSYWKTENEISDKNSLENKDQVYMACDRPLSNQKETIQESNEKESLSNIKKDESVLVNLCKTFEDSLSESQIEHLDFSGSKIDSIDEICDGHTPNENNEKNINPEAHKSSITYSTLDELSFSPDPFDRFESGLDEIPSQKEIVPSLDPGIDKSLDFANIQDSSVNDLTCQKEIVPSLDSGNGKSLDFPSIQDSPARNLTDQKEIVLSLISGTSKSLDFANIQDSPAKDLTNQKEIVPSLDSETSKSLDFENILDSSAKVLTRQKDIIPSSDPGTSKSLDFSNILDSSVNDLEMSLISWDKMNTSSKTDDDDVIFSQVSHAKKVDTNLEFDSMELISDCTQNSVALSEKSEVYRIGQIYPLAIAQNIPEERSQHLAKCQDFKHQKRLIPQTKSVRLASELCEELPRPSRVKGNFGNSMPKMDPPKKSLLSRAADLNGYRMHGSVFSDMVKRAKESRNTKVNSLIFKEEKWNPESFHNFTGSFSPQEKKNALNKEEFGTDFNSITPKMIKRTKMDAYSSRKRNQGNDLFNPQNNTTFYDFDQIVPSHNDIICSPNNEIGITVPSFTTSLAYEQPISPCLSPSDLSLLEFENDFPESTNKSVFFQELEDTFPLSPYRAFPNHNFGLKRQIYMKNFGKSNFEYAYEDEHYSKTQECSQLNFDLHSKDAEKTFALREHSNQTKIPSDSQQSLTLNFDSPSENCDDGLHEINKMITSPNSELNKTLMKDIDIDIPLKMSSDKNNCLEEFVNSTEPNDIEIQHILVSDDDNDYDLLDCQLISSSSENLKYKHKEIHTDMKLLSLKRKTEPLKSKPFEDSVTHENYNLCYYSRESCPRENKQSENIEVNSETDFSNDQQLTLTEESIRLEREAYDSLNLEREMLINSNIQLKNEISSQIGKKNDLNFIKENKEVTYSQQEIGSIPFADTDQDDLEQFPENEFLETTYSSHKKFTPDDYDGDPKDKNCSTLCSNSFSQSFDLLLQLKDQFNEPRIQDNDNRQLYDKRNLILDQIHKETKITSFGDDLSQNRKQLEVFTPRYPPLSTENNNSLNLLTPNSYRSHSSSANLKMSLHDYSFPLAQPFRSPLLTPQSLESQSPSITTTNSPTSQFSKNQSEILSDFICPIKNPKVYNHNELKFPSQQDVAGNMIPKRRMVIPVNFQNVTEYKNILTSVLKEHLNIILFELSSNYHGSLAKADLSSYQHSEKNPAISGRYPQAAGSGNKYPNCNCGLPSKMIQVRKEGKNKGRFFYTCTAVKNHQCKFFQWADNFDQQAPRTLSSPLTLLKSQSPKLYDGNSINIYLRRHHIMFYCESVFVRQSPWEMKSKKYRKQYECENLKDRLYIRLSFKESSGCYSKDDLWIISKNLNFEPSVTFIAKSAFYGPNSSSELQIEPLAGYSPSNWNTDTVCHAILAGNVSTELSCMVNLQNHVSISSSPIISTLLHRKQLRTQWTQMMPGFKTPFQCHQKQSKYSSHELASLAEKYATFWKLNSGQAQALNNVASMLDSQQSDKLPVILIHGVFGSGKSFLLAIIVLYLLDVIETHEAMKSTADRMKDEKILISSTTNVAVDRILLYLLEFGCSEFIRVGSVRKIAKPILPFSVHATSNENHDLKELQNMLKEENLSKMEKQYVRKSIEMHKLGLNKKKLCAVKVVGVTCASCSFSCLEKIKFPSIDSHISLNSNQLSDSYKQLPSFKPLSTEIVLLDECSQMTEPASLLPLARFGCENLLLVGDPMQLDPTIQGSEAEHENGLEQSLFDRFLKMGHESVLLQRQYRCHPAISHIANTLFYGRKLENGIKDKDRPKLVPELPTLCFYDVSEGKEVCESSGSFYNIQEADFVISIILALIASGIEPLSIGVIALYKSQTYQINRKMLESWQNPNNKSLKGKSVKSIQVSTVDAFQGGERDVIILSCVRTSHTGFVNNKKRMNVALTRARNHLFIVGKSSNLRTDETWSKVIQICQDSPNSFQSAKQAKIKLLDLCSHINEKEEEENKE